MVGPTPFQGDDNTLLSPDDSRELKTSIIQDAGQRGIDEDASIEAQKRIEISGNLQRLADLGIRASYHSCDVSDPDAVATVLAEIRRVDGPIQGGIHGAGVEAACHFHRQKS